MKPQTLTQWLDFIQSNHPSEIDMGLERCLTMLKALGIELGSGRYAQSDSKRVHPYVITVGGTNGKGTTCAFLENVCLQAGYRVGVFSSPHLNSFCERIRVDGLDIQEQFLCDVFTSVEHTRLQHSPTITLTYFEYATLVALQAFNLQELDMVILEVGLGGRLDAVNIIDPDMAVISSIGLDHQDYLGDNKELIAAEKAGIFRRDIPIIIGEQNCPQSMLDVTQTLDTMPYVRGQAFEYNEQRQTATIANHVFDVSGACIPQQNIATGLQALYLLSQKIGSAHSFVLPASALHKCINRTQVQGRLQIIRQGIENTSASVVADVAHNEDSARQLRQMIEQKQYKKCRIVVGMLKDKNIEISLQAFCDMSVVWYCSSLQGPRGADATRIASAASKVPGPVSTSSKQRNVAQVYCFDEVTSAYQKAKSDSKPNEVVLVMGSFLTVAAVLAFESPDIH